MNIRQLAYALYKIDWMRRISADRQMDAIKNYYEEFKDDTDISFEDYIHDCGYDGELYVCFDEFCDCEYRDKSYIKQLLNNDALFAEYLADIEQGGTCYE